MSEFTVYGIPGSPYLRSVLIALKEKALPYRFEAMKPGDQRTPEYLALHPFGRVPAIRHGEFALYETRAILQYIDALAPAAGNLQPQSPQAVARMHQLMNINDWYLFPQAVGTIAFQRIVAPMVLGAPTDEKIVADAVPNATKCLRAIEALVQGPYLVGDRLSLADLTLAPHIDFLSMTPEGKAILAGTTLEAWLAFMQERPSMQATHLSQMMQKAA